MRYHEKTALGSMLEKHSEVWRSECKNISTTLEKAELTSQPLQSMQLWEAIKSTGPQRKGLKLRPIPARGRSRRLYTLRRRLQV